MYCCVNPSFSYSLADRALPSTEDSVPSKTLQPPKYIDEDSKVTEDTLTVSYVGMGLSPKPNDRLITSLTCTDTSFSVPTEEGKTGAMALVNDEEVDQMRVVNGLVSPMKTLYSGDEEDRTCLVAEDGSMLNDTSSDKDDRLLLPSGIDMSVKRKREEVEKGVGRKGGEGDVRGVERGRREETNYDQCSEENEERSKSEPTFPYSLPLPVRLTH